MKDLLRVLKILLFLALMANSKEDLCPDHKINIDALGLSCIDIDDILEKEDLELNEDNLLYLATNNKGIIEKNNYILEIIKLSEDRLQSHNIKKSKLYISESCLKTMEEDEKIKLDKSKGIVILAYNYNKMTINNLPDIFFVMRQVNEGSQTKYMNSKIFDFSLCHEDPILFDNQINITTLRYSKDDNSTNNTNITDEINVERILFAKKKKIDLFDPHSQFLNDICFKFTSENNKDVTLDSRLEDYYQNITLCNESLSAHYMEYNYSTNDKILTFRCAYGFYESLEEKESYIDNIDSKMKFLFSTSNIKVITCFEQLFNIKELIHNYGGQICIIVIIAQIILYITFCCKGTKSLADKMDKVFDTAKDFKPEPETQINDINNTNNNEVNTENRLQNDNNNNNIPINKLNTSMEKNQNENDIGEADIQDVNVNRKKKKRKSTKKQLIANPKKKRRNQTVIQKKSKGNFELDIQDENNKKEDIIKIDNLDKKDDKKKDIIKVEDLDKKEVDKKENKREKKKAKTEVKKKKTPEENSKITQIFKLNDEDKNELSYVRAIKHDHRNFCQYYWSILQIGHIIINIFLRCDDDYNLFSVKLGLLFMLFPINLTFNIFFFTSKNIKSTYVNNLNELALLVKNLLHTFLSSIFSSIILILLKMLCLTHSSLRKLKKIKKVEIARQKEKFIMTCIKIRINVYYILCFIFLILFGYYIACFCVIFENTQFDLIKSMFTSWALSLIYPFLIYLVTSIFRMIGVKGKKRCAYKINQILQMF